METKLLEWRKGTRAGNLAGWNLDVDEVAVTEGATKTVLPVGGDICPDFLEEDTAGRRPRDLEVVGSNIAAAGIPENECQDCTVLGSCWRRASILNAVARLPCEESTSVSTHC